MTCCCRELGWVREYYERTLMDLGPSWSERKTIHRSVELEVENKRLREQLEDTEGSDA